MSQLYAVRTNPTEFRNAPPMPAAADLPVDGVSNGDASIELLRTISEVLDIRRVFARVSEIAEDVLPHDCLQLLFLDSANHFTLEACSTETFPEFDRLVPTEAATFRVVNDLRAAPGRFAIAEPSDYLERVIAAGYRSLLEIRGVARQQPIALVFYS